MARPKVLPALAAALIALGVRSSSAAVDAPGVEQHTPETTLLVRAAEFREPFFPFLDDEDATASVSVGDTSHGYLVNAKPLVENANVGILARQKARDLAWGSDEMVAMIQAAASKLKAETNTRLWIGDIGKRGGGDIFPYSVSHRAGRDADIALSYTDEKGQPVDPPDLIPLDGKFESKDGKLRFDAARTWIVVRAMLEYPGAKVQYMFLAPWLKRRLLDHAAKVKAPAELVAHAKDVIQADGSHLDHFHVRIYCGDRDLGGGCTDRGVMHDWIHRDTGARLRRIDSARQRLGSPKPELRAAAVGRLGLLDAREHAGLVANALGDAVPAVRGAAASALGQLAARDHENAIATALYAEDELPVRLAMVQALTTLGGKDAGRAIAGVLTTPPMFCDDLVDRGPDPLVLDAQGQLIASMAPPSLPLLSTRCEDRRAYGTWFAATVDASGFADRLEPVDALFHVLEGADPVLRGKAADALARITNRRFGTGWDDPALSDEGRAEGVKAWRKWTNMLAKTPRDAWVASGFLAAGYKVQRFDNDYIWELVRALARGDHLSYNAQRVLERIGGKTASARFSDMVSCSDWLAYFGRYRTKFKLQKAPRATLDACASVKAKAIAAAGDAGPVADTR